MVARLRLRLHSIDSIHMPVIIRGCYSTSLPGLVTVRLRFAGVTLFTLIFPLLVWTLLIRDTHAFAAPVWCAFRTCTRTRGCLHTRVVALRCHVAGLDGSLRTRCRWLKDAHTYACRLKVTATVARFVMPAIWSASCAFCLLPRLRVYTVTTRAPRLDAFAPPAYQYRWNFTHAFGYAFVVHARCRSLHHGSVRSAWLVTFGYLPSVPCGRPRLRPVAALHTLPHTLYYLRL